MFQHLKNKIMKKLFLILLFIIVSNNVFCGIPPKKLGSYVSADSMKLEILKFIDNVFGNQTYGYDSANHPMIYDSLTLWITISQLGDTSSILRSLILSTSSDSNLFRAIIDSVFLKSSYNKLGVKKIYTDSIINLDSINLIVENESKVNINNNIILNDSIGIQKETSLDALLTVGGTSTNISRVLRINGSIQGGDAFPYNPTSLDFTFGDANANSRFIFGQSTSYFGGLTWNYNATGANASLNIYTQNGANLFLKRDPDYFGFGLNTPLTILHSTESSATGTSWSVTNSNTTNGNYSGINFLQSTTNVNLGGYLRFYHDSHTGSSEAGHFEFATLNGGSQKKSLELFADSNIIYLKSTEVARFDDTDYGIPYFYLEGTMRARNTFTDLNHHAFEDWSTLNISAKDLTNGYAPIDIYTYVNNADSIDHFTGVQNRPRLYGVGWIENVTNFYAKIDLYGNKKIENYKAISIKAPEQHASATIANKYGIYIEDYSLSPGTNKYSIYSIGGQVYLGGSNVGLDTTNAAQRLHVVDDGDTYVQIETRNTSGISGLFLKENSRGWVIRNNGGDNNKFQIRDVNADAQRLTIDADGNVGIGTTTPSEKLEVNGNVRLDTLLFTNDSIYEDGNDLIMSLSANTDTVETNGLIKSNGAIINGSIINQSGDVDINDGLFVEGNIETNGILTLNSTFIQNTGTITDNDASPDVSAANIWTYAGSANAVIVTDLDNPSIGAIYTIIGNSDTYTITINDVGNFNLSAQWVGGIDDIITIFVQADNDYIEISRSDN